jgi:protoheme IX farnesyltransferase
MATESNATMLTVGSAVERQRTLGTHAATLADYWALTKPEVNFLILITTGAAFYLGYSNQPHHQFPFGLFAHTLLGTLLVASGTGTLNQFLERHFDAQMRRTARRPIPAGRLEPLAALFFGVLLALAGTIDLAVAANLFASFLAALTLVTYLFLYTPLKRRTPLCTLVGALPGAMPTLIGWAAATGNLTWGAWILYALLFLWQLPHFMAIAWMYREDYARAGYLVLPGGKRRGGVMAWQSAVPAVVLVLISIIRTFRNQPGLICSIGALALSAIFFFFAAELATSRTNAAARRLMLASIVYLPFVFALMVLDKFLLTATY